MEFDPVVEAIRELTAEVRGLRADVAQLAEQSASHHTEAMSRLAAASSDICTTITVWSPD